MTFRGDAVENGYVVYQDGKLLKHYEVVRLLNEAGVAKGKNLAELIPVGGIFKINVPACDKITCGIIAMKLADSSILKMFNVDGSPCFEVIAESMGHYPITHYYGTLMELVAFKD